MRYLFGPVGPVTGYCSKFGALKISSILFQGAVIGRCQQFARSGRGVFEVLDDLRDLVVAGYTKKIQQAARLDRTVTTPSLPANIDDGDVPF
ncbi:MAG: hypothetical protein CFE44_21215 [Burkholderiales bacterium PBB4]|nr:MAG: hypothetical protein CFE44_21215 [Burkholderiales bacterium PBB4]